MDDVSKPSDESVRPPSASAGGAWLHYAVAVVLLALAVYFTLHFNAKNAPLWSLFAALSRPIEWGPAPMPWMHLAWSAGAAGVFVLVGWFFLDTLEIYIPRSAAAALALILGMGLCGVLFEFLAMAGALIRPLVFLSPALLLIVLWPFALWASRRMPETGEGGDGGAVNQAVRRALARSAYRRSLVAPSDLASRAFRWSALALLGAITFFTFYHALLFPEVYWDSLILYLGYARMMFESHAIVEKVTGQVGIGLGANYPHMFSLIGAGGALAAGEWTEIPQRLLAPLAGLAATVLVYHVVLRLTRHLNFALAVALLYRAIPLGIAYNQYASDYAIAIAFAAAFLFIALMYVETALFGYFVLATLLISLAMHLNYLMGALWLPWAAMIFAAHFAVPSAYRAASFERERLEESAGQTPIGDSPLAAGEDRDPPWTYWRERPGLFATLTSARYWLALILCAFVASTWYVRNWIVTGNPVYAFFHEIFGGININPAVMESAVEEWTRNGAGIAHARDQDPRGPSWAFFVTWRQAYNLAPLFMGFFAGGVIIWFSRALAAPFVYRGAIRGGFSDFGLRFGVVCLALLAIMFGYHYVLAPYYLYQIIMMIPALAIMASYSFPYWRLPGLRAAFGALVLLIGLVPGVAMSLMGFKVASAVQVGPGRWESPVTDLVVFRHPMPEPRMFYRWRYGEDPQMWDYINRNLRGQRILTHENRHLVFDPSVELIHLDDWAIQVHVWPLGAEDKIRALKALGIQYYLKVPNEANHRINAMMGTDEWIALGLAVPEFEAGENILFRLR